MNNLFVIPTLYGREGDRIFMHGSAASRMMKSLSEGIQVCLTVSHVDGLVLARSAFHHSMNYRSAVVFGTASIAIGEAKQRGLVRISEQVLKGRWEEVRPPNEKEMKATTVLQLKIDSASAKVRTGPPVDESEDYDLPIWAGVIPVTQVVRYRPTRSSIKHGIRSFHQACKILSNDSLPNLSVRRSALS